MRITECFLLVLSADVLVPVALESEPRSTVRITTHCFRAIVWCNSRAFDSGPRNPGFETRLSQVSFLLGDKNKSAVLGGPVCWECSHKAWPIHHHFSSTVSAGGRVNVHLNREKTSTWCGTGKGNCSPGSSRFYRLFRRLKKPRNREMNARSYGLYSVCLLFFP